MNSSAISKKSYVGEGKGLWTWLEGTRIKAKLGKLAYVFDLGFDLDIWVHAEGEVLDRPTHARIARCRFMPRRQLFRRPSLLTWILQRRRRTFFFFKIQNSKRKQHFGRAPQTIESFQLAGPGWRKLRSKKKEKKNKATYRLFDLLTCHP
jgi:hypothetical protein